MPETAFNNSITTDATVKVAVQKTINIPGPGIVVAIATGFVFHNHLNGTQDNTIIHLDNVSDTADKNVIGTTEVRHYSQLPTGSYPAVPYSITRTFTEDVGGEKTYYVNCRQDTGTGGYCYGNHLTLMHFAKQM